ncbi:unnamed protein product [Ectocarpus sp. 12 AP-2014]
MHVIGHDVQRVTCIEQETRHVHVEVMIDSSGEESPNFAASRCHARGANSSVLLVYGSQTVLVFHSELLSYRNIFFCCFFCVRSSCSRDKNVHIAVQYVGLEFLVIGNHQPPKPGT